MSSGDILQMVALNDAYQKLSALSDERARHVVSLIEDLTAANAVLAKIAAGEETHPWEEVKVRLDGRSA